MLRRYDLDILNNRQDRQEVDIKPDTGQPVSVSAQALFQDNRRILELILTKKIISRKQYKAVSTILVNDVRKGRQSPLEEIFENCKFASAKTIIKEHFKYNQIIVKLAQQFIKNTLTQKLRLEKKDERQIDRHVAELNNRFSSLMEEITGQFLNGTQTNIDIHLQATGLIEETQLSFLHKSAQHLEMKALDRKFGEIAVKNRFTTKDAVKNALSEQTKIYLETSRNLIIGDILVDKREITAETRDEILLLQNRVFEEDWEATLKTIGQSEIEEQEQNAMFGALAVREGLLEKEQVIGALKIQNQERKAFETLKKQAGRNNADAAGPRWIGDILVEDFGMSDKGRKKIIKKQMKHKLEMINLKFGINVKDAHRELFQELDTYFQLTYSKNRLQAFLKLIREVPTSMTRDNIKLWLYHKKIIYGRTNESLANLLDKRTKPGHRILIASGDMPVSESFEPVFHFETIKEGQTPLPFPPIVKKGNTLVTVKRIPGKSGLNVNRCFVSPPSGVLPVTRGSNIIRKDKTFLAECDGVPQLSGKGIVSVSPLVIIRGNVSRQSLDLNCDMDVRGIIESGAIIKCRKFKAQGVMGQVISQDDVTVHHKAVNADIASKGDITLASISDSRVSGEKNIVFQPQNSGLLTCDLKNSLIFCNDTCKISNAAITSSVFRARKRIYIRESVIGEDCKFIIGDSIEISDCKIGIQKIDHEISRLEKDVESCRKNINTLFAKMEKKDITDIENSIKALLNKPVKTKDDLDRVRQLKKTKRKKEREFDRKYNDYGTQFTELSNTNTIIKKKISDLEEKKKALASHVLSLYRAESCVPELDARRATIPEDTVLQFRHTVEKTDCEYRGFIFREEFNSSTRTYEILKHRW